MFMPMAWNEDTVTEKLKSRNINQIGVEVLFGKDDLPCISDEYIEKMHKDGYLIWTNSIIYNDAEIINGGHSDDYSLHTSPNGGWGWLIDRGFDIIQTDWSMPLRAYLDKR